LGYAYGNNDDFIKAIESFIKAIALNPDEPKSYLLLGLTYGEIGKFDSAIVYIKIAAQLGYPNAQIWLKNYGNFKENPSVQPLWFKKIVIMEREMQTFAPKGIFSPKGMVDKATTYFKEGDFDNAIKELNKLIELIPNEHKFHMRLGQVYGAKGDTDNEIKSYEKAIELAPNEPDIYNTIGEFYGKKGDLDNAIKAFSKAIELDTNNPEIYFNLGLTYRQKGDTDKEIKSYEKVVELNPDDARTYFLLGCAYGENEDLENAIKALRVPLKTRHFFHSIY
jgi:tetratricopeptide (TPR) repeat protein